MNQLLLTPTDVLFFRDGRPMGGSLAGHGAAWPLPTVANAALHAALWRAGLADQSHPHGRDRHDGPLSERFGSLVTVGPFPVCTHGIAHTWFFPRPIDADCELDLAPDKNPPDQKIQTGSGNVCVTHAPTRPLPGSAHHLPLPFAVGNLHPPTKDLPAPWWSEGCWNRYLETDPRDASAGRLFTKTDRDFSDSETSVGIGIDPTTGTQDGTHLYSAHYLRLRDDWSLGLFAVTTEKQGERGERLDLLKDLIPERGTLLVGGQQRLCSAKRQSVPSGTRLPLPIGKTADFNKARVFDRDCYLVKWALLSPAIWPAIPDKDSDGNPLVDAQCNPITPHPGGWLPNWIERDTRAVRLRAPLPARDVHRESRESYRSRVKAQPTISAHLVAAMTSKPIAVTGWALGTDAANAVNDADPRQAGPRPTHLAVPAGAVYYFACNSGRDAEALAAALNWHGDTKGTTIRNRRSTLFGEKGFGLGVCGTWRFIGE